MGMNFQLPFVDELELRAKVRRSLVHALAASQHPHWSPQGCLMSRCHSNGRRKTVCLGSGGFRFCGHNSTTFLLSELGFLTGETHNPRKMPLEKLWEPNRAAKVKDERRARGHRVVCLCRFGVLHLCSYEQSTIRKLLLNSSQVLATFYARVTPCIGPKAMIPSIGPLRAKARAQILVLSFK